MHNPLNWFRSEKQKASKQEQSSFPFQGGALYGELMDNAAKIYEEHLEALADNETATANMVNDMVAAIKKDKAPNEVMELVLKLDQLAQTDGPDIGRGKTIAAIADGLRPKM